MRTRSVVASFYSRNTWCFAEHSYFMHDKIDLRVSWLSPTSETSGAVKTLNYGTVLPPAITKSIGGAKQPTFLVTVRATVSHPVLCGSYMSIFHREFPDRFLIYIIVACGGSSQRHPRTADDDPSISVNIAGPSVRRAAGIRRCAAITFRDKRED